MEQLEGYVTVRNAAKRIGISKRGVWARIYRRKLSTIRVGNIALVKFEEVASAA